MFYGTLQFGRTATAPKESRVLADCPERGERTRTRLIRADQNLQFNLKRLGLAETLSAE